MKKKLLLIPLAVLALAVGTAFIANHAVSAHDDHPSDIVGVWEVEAVAPYAPHLFTFHEDGTMTTTNPTNVQEKPGQPHGGTNDSLGMGVWKVEKQGNKRAIVGTFEQLNAFADNHMPTEKLSVSFKVQLLNSSEFEGPAKAKVGNQAQDSGLHGHRVNFDQTVINNLHL
jgi:hypothetical protein